MSIIYVFTGQANTEQQIVGAKMNVLGRNYQNECLNVLLLTTEMRKFGHPLRAEVRYAVKSRGRGEKRVQRDVFESKAKSAINTGLVQCRRCRRHMFDPWVGKIPLEEGMATYSMEYSFLKNPIDRGAWQATVHGITKSWIGLK